MGIDEAWKIMLDFQSTLVSANEIEAKRGRQRMKWMWARITDELMWRLRNDSKVKHLLESLEGEVYDGRMTPGQAADQVLELL